MPLPFLSPNSACTKASRGGGCGGSASRTFPSRMSAIEGAFGDLVDRWGILSRPLLSAEDTWGRLLASHVHVSATTNPVQVTEERWPLRTLRRAAAPPDASVVRAAMRAEAAAQFLSDDCTVYCIRESVNDDSGLANCVEFEHCQLCASRLMNIPRSAQLGCQCRACSRRPRMQNRQNDRRKGAAARTKALKS